VSPSACQLPKGDRYIIDVTHVHAPPRSEIQKQAGLDAAVGF